METLNRLISERMRAPFVWGSHDCCLWAADAVLAQTGTDNAADWRGTYSDAKGAARLVKKLGGMEAIASKALGAPMQAAAFALPGDIGLTSDDALAVCLGEWWAVVMPDGLGMLPALSIRTAWRAA